MPNWTIVRNGRLPALITNLPSFDAAVERLSGMTGETPANIKVNHDAGCPTMDCGGTNNEYDIEESKQS